MKPILDRIVVKPEEAKDKTKGGIIIPERSKEKPLKGTIIEAGPGYDGLGLDLEKGDKVLYGKNSGVEIEIDSEAFLIMRESDVYAKL